MRTATYNVDVASDRRRRENVPRHILCSFTGKKFPVKQKCSAKMRIAAERNYTAVNSCKKDMEKPAHI